MIKRKSKKPGARDTQSIKPKRTRRVERDPADNVAGVKRRGKTPGGRDAASAARAGGRAGIGRYSPHPSIQYVRDWIENLSATTGRSLVEWMVVIGRDGPTGEAECRAWLKEKFGLGTNGAWWLAERSVGKNTEDSDEAAYLRSCPATVDAMYAGKKQTLRPIHDRLEEIALSLGDEAKLCPCKTMVPVYRGHVVAQIKPTTNTRIDVGLSLGDPKLVKKAPKRLIETGGFEKKDRITHRIEVRSVDEIDEELIGWMKRAYERG